MEFVYSSTIPAIKMSVLMFYRRIFPVHRFNYALSLGIGVPILFPEVGIWKALDEVDHHHSDKPP